MYQSRCTETNDGSVVGVGDSCGGELYETRVYPSSATASHRRGRGIQNTYKLMGASAQLIIRN